MSGRVPTRGVFGLPPGVAFPEAFVRGFMERYGTRPPEEQARVEVFVNSARMLRAIRAAFDAQGTRLLPRLRLIADLGLDRASGLPPPVPALRRKLQLAQLVAAKIAQEGSLATGTAVFDLADSLASLLAEMQDEAVLPEQLENPEIARDHAEHWNRSLGFLRIIAGYLAQDSDLDAAARQRKIVAALAERWSLAAPAHPILVVGSTGSRGTTLALISCVARLPQGAIVLPGFDFSMPEPMWSALCDAETRHEDHPQFRLAQVTTRLGVAYRDVRVWAEAAPPCADRNSLVSLALRPAPMTDQWIIEGAALSDVRPCTESIALIEAPSQRAEAMAIATALREAVQKGQRAALITPDRSLTRRVAGALGRWGIIADDSAGEPLSQTPPGRLLRQIAGLMGTRVTAGPLLAVLKHPLVATGNGAVGRGRHLLLTRELELQLRKAGPAFPNGSDLFRWGERSGDPERVAWSKWVGNLVDRFSVGRKLPLIDWVERLIDVAAQFCAGPGARGSGALWDKAAGRSLRTAIDTLHYESPHGGIMTAHIFQDLLRTHLSAEGQRETDAPHPLIAIWGTQEARVQGADLVILGSLNEGSWPEPPAPDPWLSRQMRQRIGLLSPERSIGLSAHDFQQALGAKQVILSRSLRDAETETVPSRWLARLTNLLDGLPHAEGPQALKAMRRRGARFSGLVRQLEKPERQTPPQPRPAPRPPLVKRPQRLSVTQIETLLADPYAIYARHILGLRALDPLVPEPDPSLRGEVLHRLVERFVRTRPERETLDESRARLLAETDTILAEEVPWPLARRLWRARVLRVSGRFLTSEVLRSERGAPVLLEGEGKVTLPGRDFVLTARPDRIDLLTDGTVEIFDYKSGTPPSVAEIKRYRVQLLLEAAMAERGAFAAVGKARVARITYVHLGGDGDALEMEISPGQLDAVWESFERLIGHYADPATPYVAQIMNLEKRYAGDYELLSRYGEWTLQDEPKVEDVW